MPSRTTIPTRIGSLALLAACLLVPAMPAFAIPIPVLPVCGDVNNSSSITTTDALLVLKKSVAQPITLNCTAYDTQIATCVNNLATVSDELAACQATPVGQVHRTGVTVCSDEAGDKIGCAGTGQDGEFQAGLKPDFTDNGDGTVTDHRTGLVWEKLSSDSSIHDQGDVFVWMDAPTKIAKLNDGSGFADHNDWRLPNRRELDTLVNLENEIPAAFPEFDASCTAGCDVSTCSCTNSDLYWTSSPHPDTTNAWAINFFDGSTEPFSKGEKHSVRAVRGGL